MTDKQYIYIFSNSLNPGIIKVGKTDKHPEIRAEQLSRQTGAIGKYKCDWFREVVDNDFAEAFLHLVFKPFHLEKEYYKLRQAEAIKLADSAIDKLQKLVNEFFLDENELQIVIDALAVLAEDKDKLVIKELNEFKKRLEIAKSLKL